MAMRKTFIWLLNGLALLGNTALISCQPQALSKPATLYPTPKVAFGFVVYGGVKNDQMYFLPLKDSAKYDILSTDFKSEMLKDGFSFSPTNRVRDELALMDTFCITNQLHDQRLRRYMGRTLFTPVRIVYEIDPNASGVFHNEGLVDTITLGRSRYEKSGEKVTLVVRFPGADVLKISGI